jgi:hypothetical protein
VAIITKTDKKNNFIFSIHYLNANGSRIVRGKKKINQGPGLASNPINPLYRLCADNDSK